MAKRPSLHRFENLRRKSILAARVRLAGSAGERRGSLLRTTTLHDDAGLWLTSCRAIQTFGVRLPLDIIFLDKELRVCGLRPYLYPSRIACSWRAHSVLKLPAGTIERTRTALGDQLGLIAQPSYTAVPLAA